MKRKCILYKSSNVFKRHIYIDFENSKEILEYIKGNDKKFRYIVGRILEQNFMYYDDYKPIEIVGKKGITEMRIHPNGINGRVYCREISTKNGDCFVIAIKVLVKKKSMDISKALENTLKPLLDYEYEL